MGLALAIEVGRKNPAIVQAVTEFREQYGRLGEKYFGMCKAVREAKLARKESTALLLGLGLAKSRVSEILSVSEVSQVVWDKYDQKQIGFKAALKSQSIEQPAAEKGAEEVPPSEPEAKKERVIIRELAEANKARALDFLRAFERPLAEGKTTEYAVAAVFGGVKYYMQLTASPK